jgi:hypothetical protein
MDPSITEVIAALPPRPRHIFRGSRWRNKKNQHLYVVTGTLFDGTNGIDAWKVSYVRYEDITYEILFCRDIAEFEEKFVKE